MERYVCHATHVDPNRRQDPARTHSSRESLVEYHLYVTPRGLTTTAMPYNGRQIQINFDFIDHKLLIETTDGSTKTVALRPCSVAEFYQQTMAALRSLDMPVTIWTTPVEVQDRTPFEEDQKHAAYDPEYAQRFWRILVQASRVLTEFRCQFTGKVSPVHFFWGAFDLAVTRFSGRTAPSHPGAPNMARFVAVEAYSHEVSSCGFWPGGGPVDEPVFYAYAYPEPQGFKDYSIQPRLRRSIIRGWQSSFCPTMWSTPRSHLMRSCYLSCRAPMKQRQ